MRVPKGSSSVARTCGRGQQLVKHLLSVRNCDIAQVEGAGKRGQGDSFPVPLQTLKSSGRMPALLSLSRHPPLVISMKLQTKWMRSFCSISDTFQPEMQKLTHLQITI